MFIFSLPTVLNGVDLREGKWHAVLCLQERYYKKYLSALENDPEQYERTRRQGLRYSLNVHAYSNLRMRARVVQDSFEPGASLLVKAILTEYGIPVENRATVWAELTRPDGSHTVLPMNETEPGVFTADTTAAQPGIYHFLVKAKGRTLRDLAFTREQIVTASVWRRGNDQPPSSQDDPKHATECWCKFVECLLREDAFGKYLEKNGVKVDFVRRCLQAYCQGCGPTGGESAGRRPTDFTDLLKDERFASFLKASYQKYLEEET